MTPSHDTDLNLSQVLGLLADTCDSLKLSEYDALCVPEVVGAPDQHRPAETPRTVEALEANWQAAGEVAYMPGAPRGAQLLLTLGEAMTTLVTGRPPGTACVRIFSTQGAIAHVLGYERRTVVRGAAWWKEATGTPLLRGHAQTVTRGERQGQALMDGSTMLLREPARIDPESAVYILTDAPRPAFAEDLGNNNAAVAMERLLRAVAQTDFGRRSAQWRAVGQLALTLLHLSPATYFVRCRELTARLKPVARPLRKEGTPGPSQVEDAAQTCVQIASPWSSPVAGPPVEWPRPGSVELGPYLSVLKGNQFAAWMEERPGWELLISAAQRAFLDGAWPTDLPAPEPVLLEVRAAALLNELRDVPPGTLILAAQEIGQELLQRGLSPEELGLLPTLLGREELVAWLCGYVTTDLVDEARWLGRAAS
ncbi:hypothetical protein [Deinococcus marmoris]|uniref:Uncharacterized protein n=1 Tax=Deinococcus marmoris TaxID=249408 RepID=A0A1U7NSM9_9DEIO|nr:hypothetical protein [Deinococcus marmoris]OLV15915.1 hypothetical protein BOO71_0013498 [Deinococcus marmoris]